MKNLAAMLATLSMKAAKNAAGKSSDWLLFQLKVPQQLKKTQSK